MSEPGSLTPSPSKKANSSFFARVSDAATAVGKVTISVSEVIARTAQHAGVLLQDQELRR